MVGAIYIYKYCTDHKHRCTYIRKYVCLYYIHGILCSAPAEENHLLKCGEVLRPSSEYIGLFSQYIGLVSEDIGLFSEDILLFTARRGED